MLCLVMKCHIWMTIIYLCCKYSCILFVSLSMTIEFAYKLLVNHIWHTIDGVEHSASECLHSKFWACVNISGQACSKKLSKNKETKKDPDAPLKKRSAYQLFISRECDRLKNSHKGALNGENIRKLAIQSWSRLSEGDREVYIVALMKPNIY